MKKYIKIYKYIGFFFLFTILFLPLVFLLSKTPSLDRNWNLDQKILPEISFSGNIVSIKNVRNFDYKSTSDYIVNYYDRDYILDDINSLYYIIEPFSNYDGPAHTMMSFGFSNGDYLTISAEIRKEVGESFSAVKGLFRGYELVYMIGDEKDLVKLRANYRGDDVIMYPIKTDKENIKNIFVSMLKRADYLTKNPEFYNTITNNCTTSILKHANEIRQSTNKSKIGWSIYTFLPSRSDTVIYDLGLIDTSMTLEQAREYYKINDLSENFGDHIEYSKFIRKERK
ncbi:DUF4105 domain-containing protein [Candidatus Gracilibacteria bacterium]|nr:DUF4105 domain-containing protein [Candidatus Gracilibacteria bacterium]